jgi:type IV pilus assembly protein PilB
MSDPLDLDTLCSVQAACGCVVATGITPTSVLERTRQQLFEQKSFLKQSAGKISREHETLAQIDESMSVEEIKKRTESEPVVKMASLIFDEALSLNASDIHIEPTQEGALVRYRIDGLLTQHMETTSAMYVPLTSRIKIMADLDIAEKRVPQDGRIRYERHGEQYDFRVSTLPTHYGEKTVIRILKHDVSLLELSKLGVPEKEYGLLADLIEKPQGIIFVTGPTGSGKSSTLFGCLNRIKTKAINITTIENPIEYKVDGVNQVQINEKAGVTFAATLRSILRQDPDVILIGEIRDHETAEIAIQSAQTGHLVLSTLHTNDAISAITRLRDLGIQGFLISSSLIGILAQRLVRRLCPHCKKRGALSADTQKRWELMLSGIEMPPFFVPVGCDKCHAMGYKGRTGIFELAVVNDTVREMVSRNVSESELRRHFRESGMKTMIQNGLEKIEQGITSPDELLRVVMVEDILGLKQLAKEQV